jgi:hypothetical protein
MSLLGKVLAILNALVAIAFVALVSMDWAKRHELSYAAFRRDLVITGLPVDETDVDSVGNEPVVDQLSEKTLQEMFQQAGGQPVKTQCDEVKRLHDKLAGEIRGEADEQAQRQKTYTILRPLARTSGERAELAKRILDPQRSISDVTADFDGVFQTTGDPAADSLRALLVPRDERQAIAHLLFGLQPDPSAFTRVQVVIGLKEFNDEAGRQARALRVMADEQRALIVQERGQFMQHYQARTNDVRERAETLADRRFFHTQQLRQRDEHAQLLKSRQQERADIEEQIEKERARHKALLGEQAKEEKIIFDAQERFRNAKEENERLERQIRQLEKTGTEGTK